MSMVFASSTTLFVNPSSIVNTSLTPGEIFTIDINIDNVANLYGYEFKLSYDADILKATEIVSSFFDEPIFVAKNETGAGVVWFSITTLSEPKSGSGTLATITFEVREIGESTLDLYDTKLVDHNAALVVHNIEDGYFSNKQPVKEPTPTPGVPSGPAASIGAPVCEENWDCTSWSECINNIQTRTCTDLNACGTTVNKPGEERSCEVEEKSLIECMENWLCDEWSECVNGIQTRTCTDQNNCSTTTNKPLESQSCEAPAGPTGLTITGMLAAMKEKSVYLILLVLALITIGLTIIKIKVF